MPTPLHWLLDSTIGPTLDANTSTYTLDQQPPWSAGAVLATNPPVLIAGTVLSPSVA